MDEYPEHTKLLQIQAESQSIGDFLDWLQSEGIVLAQWHDQYHLGLAATSTQLLLAAYFDIDLAKLEAEKRQMLEKIGDDL